MTDIYADLPDAPVKKAKGDRGTWRVLADFAKAHGFEHGEGFATGGHNKRSLHYTGEALDIRIHGKTPAQIEDFMRKAAAAGFNVRDERTKPAGQEVWGGPHVHLSLPSAALGSSGGEDIYADLPSAGARSPNANAKEPYSPAPDMLSKARKSVASIQANTPKTGFAGAKAVTTASLEHGPGVFAGPINRTKKPPSQVAIEGAAAAKKKGKGPYPIGAPTQAERQAYDQSPHTDAERMRADAKGLSDAELAKTILMGPGASGPRTGAFDRYQAAVDEATDRITSTGAALGNRPLFGGPIGKFLMGHLAGIGAGVTAGTADAYASAGKATTGEDLSMRDRLNIGGLALTPLLGGEGAIAAGSMLKTGAKTLLRNRAIGKLAKGAVEGIGNAAKDLAPSITHNIKPVEEIVPMPKAEPKVSPVIRGGTPEADAIVRNLGEKVGLKPGAVTRILKEKLPAGSPPDALHGHYSPSHTQPQDVEAALRASIEARGGTVPTSEPPAAVPPPQTGKQGAKEPWQMTREEYVPQPASRTDGPLTKYEAAQLNKETKARGNNLYKAGDTPNLAAEVWLHANNLRRPTGGAEFTTEGVIASRLHKEAVAKALSEGKPVPPEVLADYPDLKTPTPDHIAEPSKMTAEAPKAESVASKRAGENKGIVGTQPYPYGGLDSETGHPAHFEFRIRKIGTEERQALQGAGIAQREGSWYDSQRANANKEGNYLKSLSGYEDAHSHVLERRRVVNGKAQKWEPENVGKRDDLVPDSSSFKPTQDWAEQVQSKRASDREAAKQLKGFESALAQSKKDADQLNIEFNRKLNAWHDAHPDATAEQANKATERIRASFNDRAAQILERNRTALEGIKASTPTQGGGLPRPKGKGRAGVALFPGRADLIEGGKRVVGVLNLPRTLKASVDLSAPGRQGWILGVANPKEAKAAFGAQMEALASKEGAEAVQKRLQRMPTYDLAKRLGLDLTGTHVGLPGHEEDFFGAELLKGWTKLNPVDASERAYTAYLNHLRMSIFDKWAQATKHPLSGNYNEKVLADLVRYLNIASGRGHMTQKMANAMPALASVFWSPRFMISRVQHLGGTALWKAGTPAARKIIAGEYAKSMMATGALITAGVLAGGTTSLDRRSSDFLKLKFGDTRVDLWAGLQQPFVLLNRLWTGEQADTTSKVLSFGKGGVKVSNQDKGRKISSAEALGRFAESKANPIYGAAKEFKTGKNFVGQDVSKERAIVNAFSPLSATELYDALTTEGATPEDALVLLNIFGVSANQYSKSGPSGKSGGKTAAPFGSHRKGKGVFR